MTSKVLRNLIKEMDSLFAKYHFENILTYDAGNHKMLQFELHNDWETAVIKVEFDIMFGHGISVEGDILDQAVERDVITKSGAWYLYEGNKIGQGRENAKQYLKDNSAECKKIITKLRKVSKIA